MSKENGCSYCKKNFSTKGNCTKHMKICKLKELHQIIENKNNAIVQLQVYDKIKELDDIIDCKDKQLELLKNIFKQCVKSQQTNYSNDNIFEKFNNMSL